MKHRLKRYYVVAKGRTPGIYFKWRDCAKQVCKDEMNAPFLSYVKFQSFDDIEDALEYLDENYKKR